MNPSLPPIFFYVMGVVLLVIGVLRAAMLGRRRADRELGEDTPERAKARRRHLVWGLLWAVTGVFLVVSTALHH
jgi:uncharacterized membrane protein HdeD (DUF308 family)